MIVLIIAINLSITLLNIYIAIRILQLREIVSRITAILINYESYFNAAFNLAPLVIYQGQSNIYQVRQHYQLLQLQIAKIRQLILLLNWSYRIWRRVK